ncbi:MAG: flavin reductase family protein [Minwuiales bacterium]|nr:flavin reductase family protein [Minwuiales bacterium]
MPDKQGMETVGDTAREDRRFRDCLGSFATGVAVVTYAGPDGPRGLTVNSFTSVSMRPPLVLVCLDRTSKAAGRLTGSPFAINFLHAGQREVALHFAGRPSPAIRPDWETVEGVPCFRDRLARLVCAPWSHHEAGDHTVLFGRVVDFGNTDGAPLCFFRGAFQSLDPKKRQPQGIGP